MTIRKKLILLLSSVLILPILGLILAVGPWVDRAFRQQATEVASELTTQAAGYLELYISGLEEIPQLLLENQVISEILKKQQYEDYYDVVQASWAVTDELTRFVGRRTDIETIDIFGSNGFGITGYRPVFATETLRRVSAQSSSPRWSLDAQQSMLILEQQLSLADSSTETLIRLYIPVHRIENILERFRIGQKSFMSLVAAGQDHPLELVQGRATRSSYAIRQEVAAELERLGGDLSNYEEQQLKSDFTFEKERYLLLVSSIRTGSLGLMLVVSVEDLLEPLQNIRTLVIIVLILGALVAFIAVTSLSSHLIVTPIEHLTRQMDRFKGDGKAVRATIETTDEIGHLADRYNAMLERIELLIDQVHTEEQNRRKAEWAALQAQINPHFLYNTLNTINWLARKHEVPQISQISTDLAGLFKYAFEEEGLRVSLEKELSYIRSYLNIQAGRYSDRLSWQIECDSQVSLMHIPKFILQPLIENAIKYAVEPSIDPVPVRIGCSLNPDSQVLIIVEDGGNALEDRTIDLLNGLEPSYGGHIGIAYVKNRLANMVSGRGRIDFSRSGLGGLAVTLSICLEETGREET